MNSQRPWGVLVKSSSTGEVGERLSVWFSDEDIASDSRVCECAVFETNKLAAAAAKINRLVTSALAVNGELAVNGQRDEGLAAPERIRDGIKQAFDLGSENGIVNLCALGPVLRPC